MNFKRLDNYLNKYLPIVGQVAVFIDFPISSNSYIVWHSNAQVILVGSDLSDLNINKQYCLGIVGGTWVGLLTDRVNVVIMWDKISSPGPGWWQKGKLRKEGKKKTKQCDHRTKH